MDLAKLAVIVSLTLISVQLGQQQQQCSVDRLPVFGGTDVWRYAPGRDRFQAIVPAYRFQCSGRVTEWRACVLPGGSSREQYYILFQVWRPTGIEGCYKLVDYNVPLDDARMSETEMSDSSVIMGFLSPPGNNSNPLHRCVVLQVRENQQTEFQPGDVVGYYVDHFRDGNDRANGGIQWIEDSEVAVHYRDDLPREDIKTLYAISGANPTECGLEMSESGTSDLHTLNTLYTSAPIISLSIAQLPPLVVVSSTPTAPSVTPSPPATLIPTPSLSCVASDVSGDMCGDVREGGKNNSILYRNVILGVTVSLLILIIAIISVLLWLKRRKREPELVDNVVYHSQNRKIETDANPAYHTVNATIPTATNEAYVATSVPTSPNTAYQVVPPTRESGDIATSTNEAYVATNVATSVNAAYQPTQNSSENTLEYNYATNQTDNYNLEYDYPRQE